MLPCTSFVPFLIGGSNGNILYPPANPVTTNMTHSPSSSSSSPYHHDNDEHEIEKIPIDIITDEEMALIEAAFAAARRPVLIPFNRNVKSVRSITLLAKRGISACVESRSSEIEDLGSISPDNKSFKKNKIVEPFLQRFRRKRGLSVTDITGTEWCEKQKEFELLFGKAEKTQAMKAGSARHVALEEEVIKRVKVRVELAEDIWALKLINFIVGTNQLLFDGLTRELPIIGFAEGVWMVGVIDEIRMPVSEPERTPILVDTKTRAQPTLPSEPQRRNGRLQLMCYKYLWDRLAAESFPSQKFFDFFSLNPNQILSPGIRDSTEKSGFPSETLVDLVRYFGNSCCSLPRSHDQLLLRYELQEDQSLLGEDEFFHDPDWVKDQINSCLEFWMGKREASYPPMDERWKCRFCKFAPQCPTTSSPDVSPSVNKE